MNICALCQKNEAIKTNSHIISKLFTKTLKVDEEGKVGIFVIPTGKKLQDIDKEDFLFCPQCEEMFSKLERTFANYIYHPINSLLAEKSPQTEIIENSECVILKNDFYKEYKLFVYSIVFRCHVSFKDSFQNITLSDELAENLRRVLVGECEFMDFPFIATSTTDQDKNSNLIGAFSNPNNRNKCLLLLNEIIIIFNQVHPIKELESKPNNLIIEVYNSTQWKNYKSRIYKIMSSV